MSQFTTGDVAFLLEWHRFNEGKQAMLERLNPAQYMKGACGHPVIVLEKTASHALVTTVSAHGAAPWNNWQAPWTSGRHYARGADHFRSFAGTQRPNSRREFLRLSKGAWPKPKSSFVHVENVLLVPLFALGDFTKPKCWERDGTILHVSPTSMHDLIMHIQVANPKWLGRLEFLAVKKPKAIMTKQHPPVPPPPLLPSPPPPPPAAMPAPPPQPASESGWTEVVKKKKKR
ncbi:hypothetical protein NEUTE1DRAFT_141470 [Neurospora tetrasperma FGSC 2508]|uniref:Uncharacterized protein n=1 Tax=Neurospora tetrasperma (strain FGSC 2508 / ATCC MYA-4615 / P0657) TaxID=510951 RepID=F8MY48_NEUT8|nr:uncharacterized protein NEUTE1DRAFT_141470 [Neurospora tetrasperma FGSC 2508]EGO51530.1 hypothetical protein NEUTE1DRAFT_141470 [Neurospora tetrasperma FGSC 2508]EGZ78483.1 hypothetical protein NEUTE2DRAFT_51032 [Neurospora tetrasperma FGSC 2509]